MSRYTGRHLGPYTGIQRFRNRAQRRALLRDLLQVVLRSHALITLDAPARDRLCEELVDALEPNP